MTTTKAFLGKQAEADTQKERIMAAVSFDQQVYGPVSMDVEDAAGSGKDEEVEEEWKPTGHELLIIVTLSIVSLLVALDASIIVTALSPMATAIGANTTDAFWIGTSYLLVNAVTMPIIASISEIFGRPICLEFALAMFTLGTILCASTHTVGQMLVGRCIQGVGGGGVHVLSGVIMTDIVPLRFRPKWFGFVLAAWALGTCIGPIIGGAIVEHTTWRWAFYLMFPICVYGLIAVPLLLTIAPRTESVGAKLARVDWIGSVLFMGSFTTFLVAICWAGTEHPWNSAATLVPLIVGVVGIAVTLVWEVRFAQEPILKREIFRNTSSTITHLCGLFQGFLMWGPFYYYPLYFLSVDGVSPVMAGVYLLPCLLIFIPGSIITGRLVTRYNNYRIPIWAGWFFLTVWATLAVVWRFIDVTLAVRIITMMIMGLGLGCVLNAQQFATQAMCLSGDEGHAAAMYLFLRQLGSALTVGIGGTVFQNTMALKLQWQGLPTEIANQAEAYITELDAMPESEEKTKILDAYIFGFAGVFQMYLGVAALAFILSLIFIKEFTMNKRLSSEHTLRESRTSKLLLANKADSSRWSSRTQFNDYGRTSTSTAYNPGSYHMNTRTNSMSTLQQSANNKYAAVSTGGDGEDIADQRPRPGGVADAYNSLMGNTTYNAVPTDILDHTVDTVASPRRNSRGVSAVAAPVARNSYTIAEPAAAHTTASPYTLPPVATITADPIYYDSALTNHHLMGAVESPNPAPAPAPAPAPPPAPVQVQAVDASSAVYSSPTAAYQSSYGVYHAVDPNQMDPNALYYYDQNNNLQVYYPQSAATDGSTPSYLSPVTPYQYYPTTGGSSGPYEPYTQQQSQYHDPSQPR
ncbi:major facilitator superfamily domain-containing protein [Xylariales sp. PMI_506]|nr:major facilitator superfamily domain-containing protein [Xylariales sp. PMI_506]